MEIDKETRETILENMAVLGFNINSMGHLMEDPKYYSDTQIFGVLILQINSVIEDILKTFDISEEDYREYLLKCADDTERIVLIQRDTGYDNIEFG